MKLGDIVLIRFPQADLKSGKLRPALIIGFFVTWYGSIGGHKSTKSLSGKRLN